MKQWYYINSNQERLGPIWESDLVELYSSHQINEDTWVWTDGMESWIKLSESGLVHATPPVFNKFVNPDKPMKWYKFEVYFAILASAFINIVSGLSAITGYQYADTETANRVYSMIPGLKILDIVYGIILVGISAVMVVVWKQMKDFKKNAWKRYLYVFGAVMAMSAIYTLIGFFLIGNVAQQYGSAMDYSLLRQSLAYLLNLVGGVGLRWIYYRKRDHLFIR